MPTSSEPRLNAIIVDDEERSRNTLQSLLATYCPAVTVLAQASSVSSAQQLLETEQPDVIFLDIQMPGGSGFELLESIQSRDFLVVFVTAHNKYAIRAIKASAIDYLLKPIDVDELQETVEKLLRLRQEKQTSPALNGIYREGLMEIVHTLRGDSKPKKIVLPTNEGLIVEVLASIIRLQSDNYYTTVVRANQKDLLLSKPIKEFESTLDEEQFVRVHNSHIINMDHLVRFDKREGGFVVMSDGSIVPVSRRRHQLLLEHLNRFSTL
ncbi:MAG: LytR/AlgR family response regulator transcription factor [Candidatus Kapaibacterium sp.]